MSEPKKFPWLIVLLVVGALGIECIGVLVVGGGAAYFFWQQPASVSPTAEVAVVIPVEEQQPTSTTIATQQPSSTSLPALQPTEAAPLINPTPTNVQAVPVADLTGDQQLDDHLLFDDFSSTALGWPIYDNGNILLTYADQAYRFQIIQPDYYDWAFFPVEFIPYEISFDAQGPAGDQDGTFGLFCHFQDIDNYYFVEIDLADNTYLIGQYLDGAYISLTGAETAGDAWQFSSELSATPSDVNRISVSCYLDFITLFINNEWQTEVSISQPLDQPGEAALFVYVYDDADEDGYTVIFDNVEAYQPVQ